MKSNVYVVDDDESVLDSICVLLKAEGYAVRAFDSGERFLDIALALQPGCLITDVHMPVLDGIALIRRLREQQINFPAVVITGHSDIKTAVNAMKAGAFDFLEKPFTDEMLLKSVETAQRSLSAGEAANSQASGVALLGEREREVLGRIVGGMPSKLIAHDLGLSVRTVEYYRSRIMKKLGATGMADLIRIAIAAGISIDFE